MLRLEQLISVFEYTALLFNSIWFRFEVSAKKTLQKNICRTEQVLSGFGRRTHYYYTRIHKRKILFEKVEDMKELDFNIGKSRTEFIGELVNASTNAFIYAKVRPSEKNLFRYYGYLEALHLELKTYIKQDSEAGKDSPENENDSSEEDNSEKTSIDEAFNQVADTMEDANYRPDEDQRIYDDEDYDEALKNLKAIQEKLSKLRSEIGLDIPSSSQVDPEEAGLDGL